MLGAKPGTVSDSQQPREVCSVPGTEENSQMEYPLSFPQEVVHSNKQKSIGLIKIRLLILI